jgi:DNA mismatch repair protein MutS
MSELIIDEYIKLDSEYKNKYGIKTVIFMQVGSFFELYYSVNMNNQERYGPDLKKLAEIMNISISKKHNKKNENIISFMAGFPDFIVDKYIEIMLNKIYTVVIVEQFDDPISKGSKKIRKMTNIYTPTNYINAIKEYNNQFIMCIYYYKLKNIFNKSNQYNKFNEYDSFSISCIDLSIGKIVLYQNSDKEENTMKENLKNIFIKYKPKELIILTKNKELNKNLNNLLNEIVNLNNIKSYNFIDIELDNKDIFKINYQNEIFYKIYPETKEMLISPLEYLNLQKYQDCVNVLVFLLDFIYKMNSEIIYKLNKPIFEENQENLKVPYNFITKLNIINENILESVDRNSLMNILNNCKTNIGKRYFKYNLLNPLTNINKITNRYLCIEYFNTKYNNEYIHLSIRKIINSIPDIERYIRKMFLKSIKINEFNEIYKSFLVLINCIDYIDNTETKIIKEIWEKNHYDKLKKKIKTHNNFIKKHIDIKNIESYNLDNINYKFFIDNNLVELKELKEYQIEYDNKILFLKNLEKQLNIIYNIGNDNKKDIIFKLDYNDKLGYFFLITKIRFTFFKKYFINNYNIFIKNNQCFLSQLKDLDNNFNNNYDKKINPEEFINEFQLNTISSVNKQYRITFKQFYKLNESLIYLKNIINKKSCDKFYEYMLNFYNKYNIIYKNSIKFIEWLDFNSNNSFNSIKFNYHKPIIKNKYDKPYLNIKQIRHPIIERINEDYEYIANDIELGTDKQQGILLYGINSSGKSSFMKSVGLCVVMAQSGMYVPCTYFEYYPFKKIFSRIPGGDNIFKGDSTFVGEIKELRNILRECEKNTLVIGDELCSGTETTSAIAIVYSGILELINKNSCFMFATHLHELSEIDEIKKMEEDSKMCIYHLSVENRWDKEKRKNILIFDRKLKSGSGSNIYGLEICEHLGLDEKFIKNAYNIRRKILELDNNIVKTKQSNYNKKLYMNICELCKKKDAIETHHIEQQKYANENGYIKNFHKDRKYNLLRVCEDCHQNIHKNNINITKKILTSEGFKNFIN